MLERARPAGRRPGCSSTSPCFVEDRTPSASSTRSSAPTSALGEVQARPGSGQDLLRPRRRRLSAVLRDLPVDGHRPRPQSTSGSWSGGPAEPRADRRRRRPEDKTLFAGRRRRPQRLDQRPRAQPRPARRPARPGRRRARRLDLLLAPALARSTSTQRARRARRRARCAGWRSPSRSSTRSRRSRAALNEGETAIAAELDANGRALEDRAHSPRTRNPAVRERVDGAHRRRTRSRAEPVRRCAARPSTRGSACRCSRPRRSAPSRRPPRSARRARELAPGRDRRGRVPAT